MLWQLHTYLLDLRSIHIAFRYTHLSGCVVFEKRAAEERLRRGALLVVNGEARLEDLAEIVVLFDQVQALLLKVGEGVIQRRFALKHFDAGCELVLHVVERLVACRKLQQ